MSRKFFCSPRNWIYLFQNYFSSYVYLKDICKTLKGIEKIQFISVSFKVLRQPSQKKKLKQSKLDYFRVIHTIHITNDSF